ncbi:lung adenoma susceptibility protein 2 isoform X5 [Danio rerio]|uniref:Lung adenoma susceptibility protein 2 isoform X5 n=1 Tax=Danio rerio TaxID=7955 RepID=A0A8M2BHL2_DANRE|nr:lung adenoma susceptibility protein 2 isoform X2 [Danio rerio]|eukprot:XP_005170303.1 lung adenoma susceptibility protein 2 isoform X2 [Danio rerio]
MACEERMQSPESGVSSLLASSGRLHSFLHPQPEHIITYRDKHYSSASAALDAYISDYQQSLGSRTLQLHTHTRTRKDTDVLKSSLTDRELSVLNIPTRRDSDRLSLTTDDLLDLPNDGSLPVTRTSALLTRSESFPVEHSFNSRPCSHLRPTFLKCSLCPPAELAKTLHGAHLRSQSKAPPPNILPANQRLPLDTPTYRNLPRWMSSHRVPPWVTELEEGRSQTEVKDHSGEDVSLRELRLQHTHSNTLQTANTPPLFKAKTLHGAHLRSQSKAPPPNILPANQRLPLDTPTYRNLPRWMSSHRVPPWVTELEEGRSQTEVKDHSGEDVSLRELRLQHTHSNTLQTANTPPLFKDDRIGSLILRAEQMLNSPSFAVSDAVKELNASADTEEALDVDRSWDNPPVAFKSPVPVGIAEEPPAAEDLQRSKSAASGSSGYSSRNHPGPVEALKHMLYRLQAVEQKISQSQHSITDSADTAEQETEAVDAGSGESLLRALHHLERLKTLVDDMNDRKVGAGNDGIDSTDCTRISMHT